jgi:hypothetical protein
MAFPAEGVIPPDFVCRHAVCALRLQGAEFANLDNLAGFAPWTVPAALARVEQQCTKLRVYKAAKAGSTLENMQFKHDSSASLHVNISVKMTRDSSLRNAAQGSYDSL